MHNQNQDYGFGFKPQQEAATAPAATMEGARRPFVKPQTLNVAPEAFYAPCAAQSMAAAAAQHQNPLRNGPSIATDAKVRGGEYQSTRQTSDARYDEFSALYGWFYSNYRQTIEGTQTATAWTFLKDYSLSSIRAAMLKYMRRHPMLSQMPASELVDILQQDLAAQLTSKAREMYRRICAELYNGADMVIASKRGAYALKTTFGSLKNLALRPNSDYTKEQDEKAFVKAFVECTPSELNGLGYVFTGYRREDTKEPSVVFIGDAEVCKDLALKHYAGTGLKPCFPLTREQIDASIAAQEEAKMKRYEAALKAQGVELIEPELDTSKPFKEQVAQMLEQLTSRITLPDNYTKRPQ